MSFNKARELREKRANLFEQAKDISKVADEENRALTVEERERWDTIMSDADSVKSQYQEIEDRAVREAAIAEELRAKQDRADTEHRIGDGEKRDVEGDQVEYRKAWREWVRGNITTSEFRAIGSQTKGTAADGGNWVPDEMATEVVLGLKAFGGMREAARVLTTSDGRTLEIPKSDDTANTAKLVAEATAASTSTKIAVGTISLEAHKYTSGPLKLSRELAQDSIVDFEGFMRDRMIERFARATNAHYTTRSSTESIGPHGIVNDSTGAVAVIGSTTLTAELLLDLLHSVDPAYRGNARWMMNDATAAVVRKIRWGSSEPFIWEMNTQVGQPDRLFGYPVSINQDMQSFGSSGNKPIFYGDFSNYVVRDVQAIDMKVLQERYAEEDVVAMIGFLRTDGRSVFGSTAPARKPYRAIVESSAGS